MQHVVVGRWGAHPVVDLLRRVTEAANEVSVTAELFPQAAADIRSTMGWLAATVHDTADLDDPQDLPTAVQQALRSGQPASSSEGEVAVPVVADGEVAVVLEFTAPEAVELDEALASLFLAIGRQLGSVVERERVLASLDERTAELERSNEELERFAYVASHDLQEPLRKIVGFSEILVDRYGDALDSEAREYLGYVVDGAQRMQQLIRDLLAYSRSGRTRSASEPVDLNAVVGRVLESLEWSIEEAGGQVEVGALPTVRGDAGQLAEVFTNLLANALKYAHGEPSIRIGAERVDADTWEITVADDGIGIAEEYAEQIFEVFRRLHGVHEYPGTGIGLAITRRFVGAHGGRVWVTPNHPRGSVFHVTLPAA